MAAIGPPAELTSALGRVPSPDRGGQLAVEAPRVTGAELDAIKRALEHPNQRADFTATAASVLGASTAIFKILKDAVLKDGGFRISGVDFALLAIAVGVICISVYKYISQKAQKAPFHDGALSYVDALIEREREEPNKAQAAKKP